MVGRLYLDASVLTALALRDNGYVTIAALIVDAPEIPVNSDFGWGEFMAAVGARLRAKSLDLAAAHEVVEGARSDLLAEPLVCMDGSDVVAATSFVGRFEVPLKLPDAIHIAIARRLGTTLVSTDRQQVKAAHAFGTPCINPLEETT